MLFAAACSTSSKLNDKSASAAAAGSEQDFIVNVGDRVFFPTDVTSLTDSGKETLRRQAAWLKLYPQVKILVEGHADERGTREYNLALSARRGSNTKNYLVSQGIDPDPACAPFPTARKGLLHFVMRNRAGPRTVVQ